MLALLKDDIQTVAEAIRELLNIDVTIVDDKMMRIAGTGDYMKKVGTRIMGYSAFKKSLDEKEVVIIDDPSTSEVCMLCDNNDLCLEYSEVCCPIIYEDKSYGVIGLIAFNEEQNQYMIDHRDSLKNFLLRMADLISSKLKALIYSSKLEIEKTKLRTIFESMENPVVIVDKNSNIEMCNPVFLKKFGIKGNVNARAVTDYLPFLKKSEIRNRNERHNNVFYYERGHRSYSGVFNVYDFTHDGQTSGYMIEFIDKKDAINTYNKMNRDYKIMFDNIIGSSARLTKVKEEAFRASKSASTVLITGESGTGKELFARAIHNSGPRTEHPFVAVNCAAIPDNLLESELFGYEEGAFTGARRGGKLGLFEVANKGTLFLDEIGDMSLYLQAKLLRVLQDKEITRLGSQKNATVDVRIIAATNKNLETLVQRGNFREDLYYRLNVIPINLPSLRERREDVFDLIDYMTNFYIDKLGTDEKVFSEESMRYFYEYSWPGNIRELQNTVEYCINMSDDEVIGVELLPESILSEVRDKNFTVDDEKVLNEKELNNEIEVISRDKNTSIEIDNLSTEIKTIEELERNEIEKALRKYSPFKGGIDKAASELGLSRATLYRKITKYSLDVK